MHHFRYQDNELFCEGVSVEALARRHGTPLYVYSQQTLTDNFRRLDGAWADVRHLPCYAVKANSNLAILRLMVELGSGFDVVSGGELQRVLAAGGRADRCVFAGVAKTEAEIVAALRSGIHCFNVESEQELERIDRLAGELGVVAPVALRVNPDVEARTHAKITTGTYENKFGIPFDHVESLYARAARKRHLWLRGLQMHIGSQLTRVQPFEEAVQKVAPLARRLKDRYGIEFFDIGGGLGIVYEDALASGDPAWWRTPRARKMLTPETYAARLIPHLAPLGLRILMEPGRFITGNAGILVTRVEYIKQTGRKTFVIVDAAMTELIRPAFYDAYHEIVPVRRRKAAVTECDVVGGVCESGDYFCKDRPLPLPKPGDLLALFSAGAYGSAMGSNYNSRPLAAEVLVHGRRAALVRQRQPLEAIWQWERPAPWQV
ncbi:diaminopimelate decarboxylase [Limisphaera sp. 4302-co]|uniref:diaminopimelate decarboxylase n=1 Tax=Limisphaera sp. 4302-co TaxID=3400417 RepID=UPI003C2398A8